MRVFEKLGDYLKEHNPVNPRFNKTEAPTRRPSYKFNPFKTEKNSRNRSRKSEASSPAVPIFSRKVSTPNHYSLELNIP